MRVPEVVTFPSASSTCATPFASHVNSNPETCANRPSTNSTRDTAFSRISFSWVAGISGTIATKFANGTMPNTSYLS